VWEGNVLAWGGLAGEGGLKVPCAGCLYMLEGQLMTGRKGVGRLRRCLLCGAGRRLVGPGGRR